MSNCSRQSTLILLLLTGACVGKNDLRTDSVSPAPAAPAAPESASVAQPVAGGASTPWEAARLRGADFRAVGQEPGWVLEIHDGEMLRYIGDYGQDTVVATMSQAPAHPSGNRSYSMRVGQRQVEATIREAACADAMSGEAFTHTVTLRVDAQQLSGCGRMLK